MKVMFLKVYVRGASIILKKSSEMKENPYGVLSKILSGVTLDRIAAEREAVNETEKGTSWSWILALNHEDKNHDNSIKRESFTLAFHTFLPKPY